MTSFFDLFASIALTLPGFPADAIVFAPVDDPAALDDVWDAAAMPSGSSLLLGPQVSGPGGPGTPGGAAAAINPLAPDVWDQVRIEQRVIIRVTPRDAGRDGVAPQLLPLQPMQPIMQPMVPQSRPNGVRFRERKTAKCMPAMGIAAVQPITDGRLMFYMRDHRMIAAGLEKACSARDFYHGFYMSKTADGQLCVGRDAIHSRAGTTCKLKDVREYVAMDGN